MIETPIGSFFESKEEATKEIYRQYKNAPSIIIGKNKYVTMGLLRACEKATSLEDFEKKMVIEAIKLVAEFHGDDPNSDFFKLFIRKITLENSIEFGLEESGISLEQLKSNFQWIDQALTELQD